MRDGFSHVDANLEALDGWISCRKAERDQMLNGIASLERTVNSLVELGVEKDRQIEEVEHELHNNPPALESTDEELEYANAEESKYHTPPVVKSPTL